MNDQMDPFVQRVLEQAGWVLGEDRKQIADKWLRDPRLRDFEQFPLAVRALAEFGGLHVDQRGEGINLVREPFWIDPVLAIGEEERFSRYASQLGRRLYPLGECFAGSAFLAIAEDGRVFAVADTLNLVGGTILEAIENLITGRRGAAIDTWQ